MPTENTTPPITQQGLKNTRFGNRTQLSHIQLHFLAVMLGKLTTISFPGFSHLLNAMYAKTTEPGKPKTTSTKHRCDQEHTNKKLNSDRQIHVWDSDGFLVTFLVSQLGAQPPLCTNKSIESHLCRIIGTFLPTHHLSTCFCKNSKLSLQVQSLRASSLDALACTVPVVALDHFQCFPFSSHQDSNFGDWVKSFSSLMLPNPFTPGCTHAILGKAGLN